MQGEGGLDQQGLDGGMKILAHGDLRRRGDEDDVLLRQDVRKVDHAAIERDFVEIGMAAREGVGLLAPT